MGEKLSEVYLGPTLGGYITDAASWPWIFYINIPLGAIALLLALMYVPEQKFGSRAEQVDFLGLLLLTIAIGCLQTMLERGGKLDWWASREIIFYALLSSLVGVIMGALPGLTATMALALMTTLTLKLPPNQALLILICTYVGAIYGGSRSAILLNITGPAPQRVP